MTEHPPHLDLDLAGLEDAVGEALAAGDERGLSVLGYGEMTCVIAWPRADGPWACKRLPVFVDLAQLERYRAVFDDYLAALADRGVRVHPTTLAQVPTTDGHLAGYCVQRMIDGAAHAPAQLRAATDEGGRAILAGILDHICAAISDRVGLDAQLSNWFVEGGELCYVDITTPLLRDEAGREHLDTELFMASLPAFSRPFVRRFALATILDPYYDARSAALDLLANLHKEDLARWVPIGVELANERLGTDITADEIAGHYRRDARLWDGLQRVRRADRWWQRRVRRRPYPFLIPEKIDRNL